MKLTRRAATLGSLGLLAAGGLAPRAFAIDGPVTDLVEGAEDFRAASDAYVYGYPLVTMEITRRVITNVAQPVGTRGPMGQIIKLRAYPDASFRDVTAPNADTLYTTAFFDVGDEPWVLSVPNMKGRYFLLPFLDGWTNVFAVPGSRTTGTGAQTRSICYVSDLVAGILAMAASDHSGPINIGNPIELPVRQIAEDVIAYTGSSSTIDFIDRPVDDPEVRRPDTTLAAAVLGWKPSVDWSEGLAITVDWFARALNLRASSL